MIQYYKGAYGINLLLRVHGSALYRAMIPGLLSALIYLCIDKWWNNPSDTDPDLNHPYAIGILVSSVSFLIIFRANYGYQRYWEACTAVHHMMSKWLDATVHTGVFHMQCSHYDSIKPPNYFDHPELNRCNLTRDREKRAKSLPGTSADDSTASSIPRRSLKSINFVEKKAKRKTGGGSKGGLSRRFGNSTEGQPQAPLPTPTMSESSSPATTKTHRGHTPSRLLGPGRLDGGWGLLYPTDISDSMMNGVSSPTAADPCEHFPSFSSATSNFANSPNGRTPPLFLQELAHLASLCTAVAFCTLRNDVDGAPSPLDMYTPGSKWPAADPDKLPSEKRREFLPAWSLPKNLRHWFGMDRTPEARTLYNASRPMLVLGGVSDNEIAFLQRAKGPSAKTTLAWSWLSEFVIREHLAGSLGKVGPPIVSRIFQFLSDGMIFYNHARKIMYIPFPFPHAQLSAFFNFTMVPCVPFLMDQYTNEAWLGTLLSFLTVTCLAGLHEVARELENPFRNVPNDIPLCTLQAMFNESLVTMYSGFHPDSYWDPDFYLGVMKDKVKEEKEADGNGGSNGGSGVARVTFATNTSPATPAPSSSTVNENKVPSSADENKVNELEEMVAKQAEEIAKLRVAIEKSNTRTTDAPEFKQVRSWSHPK